MTDYEIIKLKSIAMQEVSVTVFKSIYYFQ